MSDSAYDILVGVGEIWVAPVGTTMPTLDQTPTAASAYWEYVGPSEDGVKLDFDETINAFSPDTETGDTDAVRSHEAVKITANLYEATLENLALAFAATVTTVPAGSGTLGYKEIGMSRGAQVTKKAILFRGNSPYGDFPGQYLVPFGYISGKVGLEYKKEAHVLIPIEFNALVDKNASDPKFKFGRIQYGNAAATA